MRCDGVASARRAVAWRGVNHPLDVGTVTIYRYCHPIRQGGRVTEFRRGDDRAHRSRRHTRGGHAADPTERGAERGRRRGGPGRRPRGDVRVAVLLLLEEQPMHGYQLMQAIADRTGGRWTPSPGAIYPTISQLEDEGLVTVAAESGRRLVSLTDAGRDYVASERETWNEPFTGYDAAAPGGDLRTPLEAVHGATRQVARAGSDTQRAAAVKILDDARRALYLLLADDSS